MGLSRQPLCPGLPSPEVLRPWFSPTRFRLGLASAALSIALASCSLVEDLDPLQSGDGGAGTTSSTSVTSSTTTSTTSSGGGDSEGGGGGGAPDPCVPVTGRLVDCGLLARYFLDEAASGTRPVAALDAAPDPLHLPINYAGGLAYAELVGHRGLSFPTAAQSGGAFSAAAGTKLFGLNGSTSGTVEAVLDYEEVTYLGTRVVHLGSDSAASFSLASAFDWAMGEPTIDQPTEVQIRAMFAPGAVTAHYDLALFELGRVVLHGVIDTTQPEVDERMRLYLNGVQIPVREYSDDLSPEQAASFTLSAQDSIGLGNRAIGERSPQGILYYGAYYAHPLDEAQINHNVAQLLADDDAP